MSALAAYFCLIWRCIFCLIWLRLLGSEFDVRFSTQFACFWRRLLALFYVLFYWSTFVLSNVCYFVVFFTVFYSITGPSQFGFRLSLFLITCLFYSVVFSILHDYDAASYFLLYYNFKCFAFSCPLLFYFIF